MARIEEELAALVALSAAELQAEWQKVYKTPAPSLSPDLLRRGIAYRLQERAYGKLPAKVAREIAAAGREKEPEVRAGTRFVREWNGRSIDVIATDEGMIWEGLTYRSLSAIARGAIPRQSASYEARVCSVSQGRPSKGR